MQNTIQVIAFILLNLCCLIYSGFQFQQLQEAMNQNMNSEEYDTGEKLQYLITRLLIVNVVIVGICELIYVYLGARLYQEFG